MNELFRSNDPIRDELQNLANTSSWSRGYAVALLVSLGAALLLLPLLSYLDHANIVTLFLLAVVGVAARYGRGPAVLVAVLNVLSFNFAFVPPHFAFSFETLQSVLTFGVMLSVGLIVGQLTARFRYQAEVACAREERANNLYTMSRELSGALVAEQVIEISERCVEASFRAKARLLLPDDHDRLQPLTVDPGKPTVDVAIAQWCFDCNAPAGFGAENGSTAPLLYLPLRAPLHTRGVIVVEPEQPGSLLGPEQRQLLDTFAVLIAIALERMHFARVARDMLVRMEAERERNSLLAGLSHDLRTPMTALIGLTETLALELPAELLSCQESLTAIREQAVRMGLLVDNLLDMAKLQAIGGVRLRKDWQSLEELVGSAVRMLEQPLRGHPLRLTLDPALPLVDCDPVLIERVLVNLLQNAAKYTPPGAVIGVVAGVQTDWLFVEVWDEGPGLPAGHEQELFEKFTRGHTEWAVPGVGLGLAICRAIVAAHGGHIRAENRVAGGARFIFSLPLATPPLLEIDDEPDPQPL
jgi:two-component system sensor histidine kinase KdpD